ncbi:FKBP-type peptidyl-prolyl cis-trans isomerase [Horticoccus luteus]|uniref:Peptidyl-prolyl cis-trans isomerase n=1 Tax=Horticoccus luteus TaxID=2862869 RepID=A0A8F9TY78_9BACT|nr:FKBP-type peptidyl-prolyl cis-trans isomerase [Horticoccus luteus]QYM79938.1 FKBP-type peptidyl-prolyl cis-trans isomerase [Horticoccus luteus]
MKSTSLLTACALSLAAVAAVSAQEVKFSIPGAQSAAPAENAAPATKSAPGATTAPAAAPAPSFTDAQLMEELGWFMGKRLSISNLDLTPAEATALGKGIQAAALDKDAPYALEQAGPLMDDLVQKKQGAYLEKLKVQNLNAATAFFSKLGENKNVVSQPDGLRYEILQPGTGPYPKATDTVKVHYTGKLIDGTIFDTSLQPRQQGGAVEPAEFRLDSVITGWTEGLQKINKGGKIRLYVPPQLAYGDEPKGAIPPGSVLIFDIELLDIIPAAAAPAPTVTPGPTTPSSGK